MGEPIIILWVLLIKPSKNYLKIIFKISYLGLPDVTDERKKFLFNFNLNYLNNLCVEHKKIFFGFLYSNGFLYSKKSHQKNFR